MSIITVIILICILSLSFFLALVYMIRKAKEEGELVEKIEESRKVIEINNEYRNITSRPPSNANVLLDRMREDDDNK